MKMFRMLFVMLILSVNLLSVSLFSLENINIKANLEEVKVYLQGAEMLHKAKVNLEKGTSDIIISGISESIDQMSVQAGFESQDVNILSITSKRNYLDNKAIESKIQKLKDSLEILENKTGEINIEVESLSEELNLILSNNKMSGKDRAITTKELKEMADYYADRIPKLKKRIFDYNKQKKEIDERIVRIKNQLQANSWKTEYQFQYVISAKTEKKVSTELFFKYFTQNAYWTPYYDIRAKSNSNTLNISAKGFVSQNTSLDWNDVKLTLSTKKIKSNTIPNNNKITINFDERSSYRSMVNNTSDFMDSPLQPDTKSKSRKSGSTEIIMAGAYIDSPLESSVGYGGKELMINTNMVETEYIAEDLYTIPSDGKEYSVFLTAINIESEKEYYAVPKKSLSAFRVAKIKNNSDFKLLNSSSNIYYDGTYLGKTNIKADNVKDDIKISLGTDESIVIDRELLKEYQEEKFLSSDVERIFAYKNVIRNNKKEDLKITIDDFIPISQNEDIKVKIIDIDGSKYDEFNGIAKWELVIKPGESAELKTIYSIRYPNNKNIIMK